MIFRRKNRVVNSNVLMILFRIKRVVIIKKKNLYFNKRKKKKKKEVRSLYDKTGKYIQLLTADMLPSKTQVGHGQYGMNWDYQDRGKEQPASQ